MIRQKLFVQSNASSSVRRGTVCSRKEKEQGELGLCKLNSEFRHICVAEPTQVSAISIRFVVFRFVNPKYVDQTDKLLQSHYIY